MEEGFFELEMSEGRAVYARPCDCCEATEVVVVNPDYVAKLQLHDIDELQQVIGLLATALMVHRGESTDGCDDADVRTNAPWESN